LWASGSGSFAACVSEFDHSLETQRGAENAEKENRNQSMLESVLPTLCVSLRALRLLRFQLTVEPAFSK
jgi:hypothetical protein